MADASVPQRKSSGTRRKDISGQRFERLTVQAFSHSDGTSAFWTCLCDCGKTAVIATNSLQRGNTRSCGCLQFETQVKRLTTHGHCPGEHANRPPEYHVWQGMIRRCEGAGTNGYFYSERGIAVCDRWLHSFESFMADMGSRPSDKHSTERKDNGGHYRPDNYIWATRRVQTRNTRQNHNITFQGETLCLTDWAARIGIHPVTLHLRLKRGWSIEKAITTPKLQ